MSARRSASGGHAERVCVLWVALQALHVLAEGETRRTVPPVVVTCSRQRRSGDARMAWDAEGKRAPMRRKVVVAQARRARFPDCRAGFGFLSAGAPPPGPPLAGMCDRSCIPVLSESSVAESSNASGEATAQGGQGGASSLVSSDEAVALREHSFCRVCQCEPLRVLSQISIKAPCGGRLVERLLSSTRALAFSSLRAIPVREFNGEMKLESPTKHNTS